MADWLTDLAARSLGTAAAARPTPRLYAGGTAPGRFGLPGVDAAEPFRDEPFLEAPSPRPPRGRTAPAAEAETLPVPARASRRERPGPHDKREANEPPGEPIATPDPVPATRRLEPTRSWPPVPTSDVKRPGEAPSPRIAAQPDRPVAPAPASIPTMDTRIAARSLPTPPGTTPRGEGPPPREAVAAGRRPEPAPPAVRPSPGADAKGDEPALRTVAARPERVWPVTEPAHAIRGETPGAAAARTEPPSVSVTIGRIEIRAVSAAPTPTPRRGAVAEPRDHGLERYLRGDRRGGAP